MTDRRSATTQPFLRLLRNSQVARLRPRQLIAGRPRRRYSNSTSKTDFPLHNTVTLLNGRDSANDIAIKLICFHAARWRHRIMLKLKIRSYLGFSPHQGLQDEPIQVKFRTKEHTRTSNLNLISEERRIAPKYGIIGQMCSFRLAGATVYIHQGKIWNGTVSWVHFLMQNLALIVTAWVHEPTELKIWSDTAVFRRFFTRRDDSINRSS